MSHIHIQLFKKKKKVKLIDVQVALFKLIYIHISLNKFISNHSFSFLKLGKVAMKIV